MRWVVFAVLAVVGLIFDTGLSDVMRIEKLGHIRPSLCAVVAVFVALSAPRTAALWACFVLGLLLDLSHPLTVAENRVAYLIGPSALGYLFGGETKQTQKRLVVCVLKPTWVKRLLGLETPPASIISARRECSSSQASLTE